MKRTIGIGGETRPIDFGTLFLLNYQERFNQNPLNSLNTILANMPKDATDETAVGASMLAGLDFKFMVQVLKTGLETGAEIEKTPLPELDRATLAAWVDEAGGVSFLVQVMLAMFQWMPSGKPEKEPAPGTALAKKKALRRPKK